MLAMTARGWIAALLGALALSRLAGLSAPLIAVDAAANERASGPAATTRDTNLRKAPGTGYEILALIPKGTRIDAGNCRNGWCRVSWNGYDGYVAARNLSLATAPPGIDLLASRQDSDHGLWLKAGGRDIAETGQERGAEHGVTLEIGTAGEWPLDGARPNFGGTVAAEIEPIENWLELEFGLTALGTAGHNELSGDILFKKPFRLSPTVEFMVGAGPSLSRTFSGPDQGNAWSTEFALDWMFWPTKDIGWYIEPTWSVNPRNGQQAAAVSIGLLIGLPKP